MLLSQLLILLVMWKGGKWREESEKREEAEAEKQTLKYSNVHGKL